MAGTSTQCNKIILLLIIVILMYLLLCKGTDNSNFLGNHIARLTGGGVKKITEDNFDKEISKHNIIFVKIYTDWCGFCKKLAPTWKEFADYISSNKNKYPGVVIAEIDADKHQSLATQLGAKGYPTILLIKGGKVVDTYKGERNVDHFRAYLNKHI